MKLLKVELKMFSKLFYPNNHRCRKRTFLSFHIGVLIIGWVFIVAYPIKLLLMNGENFLLLSGMVCFRLCLYFWFFHTIGYWFYKILPFLVPSIKEERQIISSEHPKVAIIIPIRDEPEAVVRRMLEALTKINYTNYEVIIVDNSSIPLGFNFNLFVQKSELTLKIVRKEDTKGFKAGALNCALKILDNQVDYVLILDADHAPQSDILKILIPFLQSNKKLAFVQAPQRFKTNGNKILSHVYNFQQRIFFDHLCPGMSILKSLFMTGTNMLIRKSALDKIGGFDESTLTEDVRTSLLFHQGGWEGIYVNKTVAVGYPPPDIASYHRQQRRWAIGTFQNFFETLKLLFHSPNSLKIEQWLQYLGWNGTWYFQGFCNLFLVWSSIIFLLTGFKPYIRVVDDFLVIVVISTLVYQIINEHKQSKTKYFTLFLSQAIYFGNSIIFVLAFIDLICGRNISFYVTKKVRISTEYPSPIFTIYHSLFVSTFFVVIGLSLWTKTDYSLGFFIWPFFFSFQSLMNLLFPWVFNEKLNAELPENREHVRYREK